MPYTQTIWANREVERPRTFNLEDNGDGTTTLIPAEGNIITQGTPIIASNMNNIEDYLVSLANLTEVVEKGSNANGHYMRWANGFQLAWGMVTYTMTTGVNGALHSATLPSKALPTDFSHTTYYCGVTAYFTEAVGMDVPTRAFSSFVPRVFTISALTAKVSEFGFLAFGRWYE